MNKKKLIKILKIILIILLVVIVLFLINAFRKFIIVKGLKENFKEYATSNNYHMKMITDYNDGTKVTTNYYKKDNKEANIIEKNKDGTIEKLSIYNNGTRKDVFYDNSEGKKVELNTNLTTEVQLYDYFDMQTDLQLFFSNIFAKIKKIEYNGKECYCLNNSFTLTQIWGTNTNEVYIEKDTGLVLKTKVDNVISEREYEFDSVQDGIFVEPDVSEYELIEK